MSKLVQIKIFNQILDNFFDFLQDIFVYLKSDIILSRTTTDFIRRANPRMVVETFMEYTRPYSKQLFECDETFFLGLNIENVVEKDYLNFGEKIKRVWLDPNTTQVHKAMVFQFFHKLLSVGAKV
jgi:hypothetical protein